MSLSIPAENDAPAFSVQSQVPATQRTEAAPSPPVDTMDISPAPDAAPSEPAPLSQPMTATPSNSSEHPPLDANDANGPTPYGTRSRNRTNGSRPNYADDKDIDLEIEAAAKASKQNKKAHHVVTSGSLTPATPEPSAANGTGAPAAGMAAQSSSSPAPAHQPGSGVYNVLPPPQPASKKRKAPGSNATVSAPTQGVPKTRNVSAPQPRFYVETNMMSFDHCGYRLNARQQLVADDGTVLQANDHAYFICEPPGEPYYLARIMEFLHPNNDPAAPVDAVRVNWYYRPKDIQRRVQDTRVVFASMHSDTCPLTSIRGKCNIQHLSSLANLDEYRMQKDSFWFDKLYDRYMHRYYEVIPTDKVVNVPPHVKKVLDERWKFVLVEVGRGRDLTAASKKCKRCQEFAANNDSVDCAVCKFTYHMACVRPPLLKKPARGFAWACAACSRAQELALQQRHTPTASDSAPHGDDDLMDEEDDSPANPDQTTRDSSVGVEHPPPTAAQLAQANLWPYRYLGIHSKAEDALDYDDRIYPRASSRLGPRHQANVMVWHGRPVELVRPAEGKKKYKPAGGKKDAKTATTTDSDRDKRLKRPKWVIDEPPGYIARGDDEPIEVKGKKEYTAQVVFKLPEPSGMSTRGLDEDVQQSILDSERITEEYMDKVKPLAAQYNLESVSTDFLTKAVEKLQDNDFDIDKALEAMKHLSVRGDLKLPDLNREEVKRFEEGVSKYGSELHLVARHVSPTIKESRIVRFYYMWKKTERGRQIWGTYEGRKSKKESRRVEKDGSTKLLDDVADDQDDSAFDNEKAMQKKRGFICKFCDTKSSRQWRRAPGTAPGTLVPADPAAKNAKEKSTWLTLALCGKCAYLWRRYAIQYESVEEVAKKIAAAGGRAAKRRVDEELMRTVIEAQCEAGDTITKNIAQLATSAGVDVPAAMVQSEEPPKKKTKADKEVTTSIPEIIPEKKKPQELEPLEPEAPRVKIHPCAVCGVIDLPQDKLLKCRDCRLHVHASCYGVSPGPSSNYWYCDTCKNDHNTQVSTVYDCVLCPVSYTPQELMEPPKVSHKKKTDREREKERLEREMVQDAGRRWRQEQEAAGRPVNPREPYKPTAGNNWMHVYCAVWTKEIKFGSAELLHAAEGVPLIPAERFKEVCRICKKTGFPTATCQFPNCGALFHIGCAHQIGFRFGFDVAPVKGSRRDSVAVMKLDQEVGAATPAIWCNHHTAIPTMVHDMTEVTPNGLTAMQEYVRVYKQVDTSITATARRAAQITGSSATLTVQPPYRRASGVNGAVNPPTPVERASGRSFRSSPSPISPTADDLQMRARERKPNSKKCCSCLVEVSPRWWLVEVGGRSGDLPMMNGLPHGRSSDPAASGLPGRTSINGLIKTEPLETAPLNVLHAHDQTRCQCHKCHVEKRTPPSSPSQVKPREKPPPEPVPEPVFFPQPNYSQPPQPTMLPPGRPAYDTTPHSHPSANGISTPAPPPPPPPPSQHTQWSPPTTQWAPGPPVRNGSHPPPGPPYGAPPPYRPGLPPPSAGPEYNHPYGRPVPPAPGYSSVPPPVSGPRPSINGVPQHSPPPTPYGQAPTTGAPPPRAPSPRGYAHERSGLTSPQIGLGASSVLSRPFAPPDSARSRSTDMPVTQYGGPSMPPGRPYQTSLPPPSSIGRPPTTPSLTQMAQAASEQVQSRPPQHSRHPSVDAMGTPRLGGRGGLTDSPSLRHDTPADMSGGHASSQVPANRADSRRSAGPGASASPSLRNLLS